MFRIFKKKKCKCEFDVFDLVDMKTDPECVHCGKKLSEYEEKITNNERTTNII